MWRAGLVVGRISLKSTLCNVQGMEKLQRRKDEHAMIPHSAESRGRKGWKMVVITMEWYMIRIMCVVITWGGGKGSRQCCPGPSSICCPPRTSPTLMERPEVALDGRLSALVLFGKVAPAGPQSPSPTTVRECRRKEKREREKKEWVYRKIVVYGPLDIYWLTPISLDPNPNEKTRLLPLYFHLIAENTDFLMWKFAAS